MSDRWYRGSNGPREFDGASFMATVPQAGIDAIKYLEMLPPPQTRFGEVAASLLRADAPYEESLVAARELQQLCGTYFGQSDEFANFQLAMGQISDMEEDIKTGDYIVKTFGERFIAKLGGYSLDFVNGPTITLRLYDPGVSARRASLPRLLRRSEASRVPVMSVDSVLPYEA